MSFTRVPQSVFAWGLFSIFLAAGAGYGDDWPQWGGGNSRNMASRETGIPDGFNPGRKKPNGLGIDLATTKNVRWVVRLGSENYSSPVIAGGRVYIGTNDAFLDDPRFKPAGGGVLLCLDEATGKVLWRLIVPKYEGPGKVSRDFDRMELGICATATVEGNRVYLVTNRAEVLCLDVAGMANGNDGPFLDERYYSVPAGEPPVEPDLHDADIIWRFDMLGLPVFPHDAAACATLVYGDVVYVVTGNGVSNEKAPLPLAPSLVALDKKTGRLLAKDDEMVGTRMFHGQWSSAGLGIVNDRPLVLFGAGDGICYAFDVLSPAAQSAKTPGILQKVWSFDCNPPEHRLKDGKPINYWDGDRREARGNTNDGTYVGPNEIIGTPVFYHNRVYVTIGQDPLHGRGKGCVSCFDAAKTGDLSTAGKVWIYTDIDRSLSTVSIADGLVYVADVPGRIHCLDAETGKCYWVHDTDSDIWSSTLVADGKVIVGTRRSLWVLQAGKEAKVLNEIRLGSQIRSTPAAANGTLYVASQRYLWAVQAERKAN